MNCDYCGTDHHGKPCPRRKRECEERDKEQQHNEKVARETCVRGVLESLERINREEPLPCRETHEERFKRLHLMSGV
eukprot:511051-Rhodomonas_salina.1